MTPPIQDPPPYIPISWFLILIPLPNDTPYSQELTIGNQDERVQNQESRVNGFYMMVSFMSFVSFISSTCLIATLALR